MGNPTEWLTGQPSRLTEAYDTVDAMSIFMRSHPRFCPLVPESTSLAEYLVLANGSCGTQEERSTCTDPIATTGVGQDY